MLPNLLQYEVFFSFLFAIFALDDKKMIIPINIDILLISVTTIYISLIPHQLSPQM